MTNRRCLLAACLSVCEGEPAVYLVGLGMDQTGGYDLRKQVPKPHYLMEWPENRSVEKQGASHNAAKPNDRARM